MQETGEVISVEGGSVTVRLKRTSACERCGACRVGVSSDEMVVTAKNECAADLHDRVRVELKAEAFLSAVLILYGLPLIGLMLGAVVGSGLGRWLGWGRYGALAGFACGVVLAGAAYAFIRRREPVWREKGYTPAATQVVKE